MLLGPEQKAQFGRQIDRLAVSWEGPFGEAANRAFEHDRRELLAALAAQREKGLRLKASTNWSDVALALQAYLLTGQATEAWQREFLPLIAALFAAEAEQLGTTLGVSIAFDVTNIYAVDWFNQYTLSFAKPIVATTSDAITNMLGQAMQEGWSIRTMERRLGTMFDQWMRGDVPADQFAWYSERMPQYRREMIARTETMRASNAGSYEIYDVAGVQSREWLATGDNRTRETHLMANGQVKPMGIPFIVGGYPMMYPGDASMGAPPGEFINCRCTIIPVVE